MTNLLLITSIEKSYDPVIIKEWLNSYSYLYKGFTPNKGQLATMDGKVAKDVIFYSRNGNMGIFITENGLSYVIYDIEKKENSKDKKALPHIKEKPENSILHYARIDYELIGGKIKKENIIYQDELPGYENFYLAHCPDGILFVKSYRKVIIKDVYPGINWIFRYDDNGNFHHEFEIKNPQLISQIKLKVKYADIELVDNGKSIILSTPIGKIKDGNLIGYQGNNIVEVSYKLIDNNLITFDVKSFDKDKPLLIDPYARYALLWSTYYGGSGNDIASSITIDNYGNIFITGNTISIDFPLLNFGWGAYFDGTCGTDGNCNNNGLDAFILKFNNLGLRLWATYYGGSGHDVGESITTDAQGNVFVVGETFSPDFPLYKHVGDPYIQKCILTFNWDIFILKFNNWGVRLWSTCYGGKRHDFVSSIVSDYKSGDIFITGTTGSDDFPTYDPGGGAYYQVCNDTISSAYILRFDNLGTLKWATCYGGSRIDDGISITIDINSNIFLTGKTNSIDFPLYNPGGGAYFDSTCGCDYSGTYYYYDVFIVKFNSLGQRLWATYYGGSREEWGLSMVSDAYGNIFISGRTFSNDFPTYNPGGGAYYDSTCGTDGDCNYNGNKYFEDIFILKFSNSGQRLWATYYGGSSWDYGFSITIDNREGSIFVTGKTWSCDFPLQPHDLLSFFQDSMIPCPSPIDTPNYDSYILKFTNLGVRKWATYFGGKHFDIGTSIKADAYGNVFVVGSTESPNFPIKNPGGGAYFQEICNNCIPYPEQNHSGDVFISKFGLAYIRSEEEIPLRVVKDKIILNFSNLSSLSYQNPIIIKIYSLDGKLIYSNIFKTNNIEINLKSLKPGIYILKAYSKDNKQLTYKFIKN